MNDLPTVMEKSIFASICMVILLQNFKNQCKFTQLSIHKHKCFHEQKITRYSSKYMEINGKLSVILS